MGRCELSAHSDPCPSLAAQGTAMRSDAHRVHRQGTWWRTTQSTPQRLCVIIDVLSCRGIIAHDPGLYAQSV